VLVFGGDLGCGVQAVGCRDLVDIDGIEIVELLDLVKVHSVDGLGLVWRHIGIDFGCQLRKQGSASV
jgi:hypothetical protein